MHLKIKFIMKIISSLLVIITMFSINSIAQNLVPNPSFEDTVSCPTMFGQVTKCKYWYDVRNTPDYFNECCVIPQVGVPNNVLGYQFPNSGNAYMGFYTLYGQPDTNYREVIGTSLTTPLVIGTKYYITMLVSLSGNFFQGIRTASNKTGILFSTYDFISSPPPINDFSQVFTDSIITDTLGWTTIRSTFVADSNYSFISIGNFFHNYLTDTIHLTFANGNAYYYLDDLCISDDSLFCELWTGLMNHDINEIKIFPNPASNLIHIENIPWGCLQIDIINVNGRIEDSILLNYRSFTTIDLTKLSQGLYLLNFKFQKKNISKKILHISN